MKLHIAHPRVRNLCYICTVHSYGAVHISDFLSVCSNTLKCYAYVFFFPTAELDSVSLYHSTNTLMIVL
jgi:hypothetical protein